MSMLEQGHLLRQVARELADDAAGVLVVTNYTLGRRRVLYCPNCGRPMRLGISGAGVVEVICRSRDCEQNPHETKIIFRVAQNESRKGDGK